MSIPYVDAHCHAYSFSEKRLKELTKNTIIVGVSMNLESSKKIVELSKKISNMIPMVGIHPWEAVKATEEELEKTISLISEAKGFGEVGIDGKTRNFEKQVKFFERILKAASEYDVPVNIHARQAWAEALDLVMKYEIKRAIFHWYSGPTEFLRDFAEQGYFITINPSVIFQDKHLKVLEQAPLSIILTESDGPYQYRGRYLTPAEIPQLVSFIAKVKQTTSKRIKRVVYENLKKIFEL